MPELPVVSVSFESYKILTESEKPQDPSAMPALAPPTLCKVSHCVLSGLSSDPVGALEHENAFVKRWHGWPHVDGRLVSKYVFTARWGLL